MRFPPELSIPLFFVMLVLMEIGRRVRARRGSIEDKGFPAIEGAIFTLFGLLLAFTFSSAMSRWDAHRKLAVEEATDIHKAYLQIDLLPASAQPQMRQLFREYATLRARRFDNLPNTPQTIAAAKQSKRFQEQIWNLSLQAVKAPGASPDAAKLVLPSVTDMIDVTFTRRNVFYMHPPSIVFILLLALSCACALLAGYGMTSPHRNLIAMLGFAFFIAFTIYVTLEIEYPRLGVIRLNAGNHAMVSVRSSMD